MKPNSKKIHDLQGRISHARSERNLSYADLATMASVHPSQVSRICAGDFKTFSNNVVQICKVLDVKVPRLEEEDGMDADWKKVHASLRRIWDETPEGAAAIRRMLDAVADLRSSTQSNDTESFS